ncbi:MAG TPA: 5-oxoprolinase subunit PxpA [Cyclobacteriaceae bacterium]|jgi:UPF0271 protein|nr:5-oxoprolinase subunit PxpA [Cyclobacteriaceae bacterium]
MNELKIDINCDMAEGVGNEKELMPFISSANIACGYHAGNEDLMKSTIDLCLKYNVAIGAHPSFPDRENFGRTNMNLPLEELNKLVSDQIHLLNKIAKEHGAKLHHVKPHGALYNMAAKDSVLANCIARAIKDADENLILYGLSQSAMIDEAKKIQIKTANEVFADRTYQLDGSLTPRTQSSALITDEQDAILQAVRFVSENKVKTVKGIDIDLKADTICLHGDGAHAVEFARLIYSRFGKEKIKIQAFN